MSAPSLSPEPPPVLDVAREAAQLLFKEAFGFMLCGLSNAADLILLMVVGSFALVAAGVVVGMGWVPHLSDGSLYALVGISVFISLLSGLFSCARDVAMIQLTQAASEGRETVTLRGLSSRVLPNVDLALKTQIPLILLVILGMLFFFIPGIVLLAACPALVSEVMECNISFGTAVSRSLRRFMAFPGWHIRWYYLSMFSIFIVGSLPVVGLVLVLPTRALLEVYAWRALRGCLKT